MSGASATGQSPLTPVHHSTNEQFLMQLMDQLKVGGRLIVPIGRQNEDQVLVQVTKNSDGTFRRQSLMGVVYVPLTDRASQYSSR